MAQLLLHPPLAAVHVDADARAAQPDGHGQDVGGVRRVEHGGEHVRSRTGPTRLQALLLGEDEQDALEAERATDGRHGLVTEHPDEAVVAATGGDGRVERGVGELEDGSGVVAEPAREHRVVHDVDARLGRQ